MKMAKITKLAKTRKRPKRQKQNGKKKSLTCRIRVHKSPENNIGVSIYVFVDHVRRLINLSRAKQKTRKHARRHASNYTCRSFMVKGGVKIVCIHTRNHVVHSCGRSVWPHQKRVQESPKWERKNIYQVFIPGMLVSTFRQRQESRDPPI